MQFWVELPTAADAARYRTFLGNYAAEQQRSGRFHWPPHTRLRDVKEWLMYRHAVSDEVRILVLVAFSFLFVCLLNAMGLMLAKIMGRAGDIGVRRALGASRARNIRPVPDRGRRGRAWRAVSWASCSRRSGLLGVRAHRLAEHRSADALQIRPTSRIAVAAGDRRHHPRRTLSHLARRAGAARLATESSMRIEPWNCVHHFAMRRNKIGAILIAVQMAVTLAILCNALFIIEQRVAASHRPSGADEANVFCDRQSMGGRSATDLAARLQTDLAALRALPGVVDAYVTNSYPLSNGGDGDGSASNPISRERGADGACTIADEHALARSGRETHRRPQFHRRTRSIDSAGYDQHIPPSAVIITRALAEKLFPDGESARQDRLHRVDQAWCHRDRRHRRHGCRCPGATVGGWGSTFFDNSILEPYRLVGAVLELHGRARNPGSWRR